MRRMMWALVLVATMGASAAVAAGSDTIYPRQLLESKPALNSQYQQLIQPIEASHGWVTSMGTQTPVAQVSIGDHDYAVLTGCKPHDCASESIVSLMTPSSDEAVGALVVNQGQQALGPKSSTITWLGQPDRGQRRFIAAYLFR